jgi:amino acid adenylation domain-containing protein
MNSLKGTIITHYWRNKLKDKEVFDLESPVSFKVKKILLESRDSEYFTKLTLGSDPMIFTVCLSVFNVLLTRYFGDVSFVFSKSCCIKDGLGLLYSTLEAQDIPLKSYLESTKLEVQQVFQHAEHDLWHQTQEGASLPFESYTPFGFFYEVHSQTAHSLPFVFQFKKLPHNSYECSISYSNTFVKEDVVEHFLTKFKEWIEQLEFYLNEIVTKIPLLTLEEKKLILEEFNQRSLPVSGENYQTLPDLFEEQTFKEPLRIAVIYENEHFSYLEINERANQLAYYLKESFAVQAGTFVSIKLKRDANLIVAILAVLKSGAAYVPIDIAYPEGRIAFIETDSQSKVIIDQDFLDNFNAIHSRFPKENFKREESSLQDTAYLIYTSGTTGNPKGVMISHSNAIAFIQWAKSEFDESQFNMVYAVTSQCFDLSVFEMFYPLAVGSTIRVLQNALDIQFYLQQDQKVLLNTVPSVIRELMKGESVALINKITVLNLAGEPFPADLSSKLAAEISEVRNLYGPSEDTTYSTIYKVLDQEYTNVPIGKPISGTKAYILDKNLDPLPIGVAGKLYLAGSGVAKGYLNREELTNEKFIPNPFDSEERMYDTGDLAQWLPDGNILFLGRKDAQVKIRGYRIELGEIENTITQFSPLIQQVIVDVKTVNKEKALVAYYNKESLIDVSALREYLREKLPSYMIPSFYVGLTTIPLTPNGKVDRKALPDVSSDCLVEREQLEPRNEVEQTLLDIWQEVLGTEHIAVNDNFFQIGGHSLMISQLMNKVHKTLGKTIPFKVFYSNPTIENISRSLESESYKPIEKTVVSSDYPVTPAQSRLWFLSQEKEGCLAYQIPAAIKLKGEVDVEQFSKAFSYVCSRHESLQTYFHLDGNGVLRQFIDPEAQVNLKFENLSSSEDADLSIGSFIDEKLAQPFDLSKAPLIQAYLIKRSDQEYVFFICMHHIISDGWSLENLNQEVLENYSKLRAGMEISLPELPIQFKDYAVWLTENKNVERLNRAKDYWLGIFKGEIPVLSLPTTKSRPLLKTYEGKEVTYCYSEEILEKLKNFSKNHHVTLFTTLLSAIKILLSRYSNQKDIIIGMPVAGREHSDLEKQIGLYLNTVALRTNINPEDSFLDILLLEKQLLLDAYVHQQYPFSQLVEDLTLKRDASRSPIFDVLVALQNHQQLTHLKNREGLEGVTLTEYQLSKKTTQLDLSFVFIENNGLSLSISYNTSIYEESFITNVFSHLEKLFEQIVVRPETHVKDIGILTFREKRELLEKFNSTAVAYPADKTVVDLFVEQAARTPDAVAVLFEDTRLTFGELDALSSQFSTYLIKEYGLQAGDLVGVKLERSEWLIVTLLGILKSRCGYVPIDVEHPQSRIDYIMEDSNSKLCVDSQSLQRFQEKRTSYCGEQTSLAVNPADMAYVIYTSGSTGKPKGVLNNHSGLYNRLLWMRDELKISSEDIILQKTPYTFDVSVWELFMSLVTGGTLVVCRPQGHKDPFYLQEVIQQKEISIVHFVPSMLNTFLSTVNPEMCSSLKHVVCSGEALPLNLVEQFREQFEATRIHNLYGPTEAAIDVTYINLTNPESTKEGVSIGKPVANTHIYIVNEAMQLQPVGVTGEIVIGGVQVAEGYVNRPELTQEKFIASPFVEGERLYKTGDLGRWLPGGCIEYLGRKDHQVKIRGYRIELGEIEHAMMALLEIQQAAVLVQQQQADLAIVAYFTSVKEIDKQLLRSRLSEILPDYMLPTYFIRLESIPLTSNGKVDKKALPEVGGRDKVQRKYVAPGNVLEKQLVAIWEEVLGTTGIGVTDSFFEVGGHSLKAILLINRIKRLLGLSLSVQDVFVHPTITGIVTKLSVSNYHLIPKAVEQNSYDLTPSQRRLWVLSQLAEGNFAYNIPGSYLVEGSLDVETLNRAFKIIVARHESLRTVFKEENNIGVRQFVVPLDTAGFSLNFEDLSDVPDQDAALDKIIKMVYSISFDLGQFPLFKVGVIKLSSERSVLWFNMHHIISDGWSMEVLVKELMTVYHRIASNQSPDLPPLPIQYKDYAEWFNGEESQTHIASLEDYWLKRFSGDIPILELPASKKRPLAKTYDGDSVSHTFTTSFSQDLQGFAKQRGSSLFMLLLAGVNGVFSRYVHKGDIILGTPVAGREHPDLENQIGLFLNTLPIRTQFDLNTTFEELLETQKNTLTEAYTHQGYPFDRLVEQLNLPANRGRSPLFDVMVVLQNQLDLFEDTASQEKDFSIRLLEGFHRKISQFDIIFIFTEREGLISLHLEYNTNLYHAEFIRRMISHLEGFLKGGIEIPQRSIATIDYLTKAEEKQLLYDFNNTEIAFPSDSTIVSLLREQVRKNPSRKAVVFGDTPLSYEELETMSNQMAHCLIEDFGVSKGDLVGVQLNRSETFIASILAVLKSGAAYVPIDPQYPTERKRLMTDDANIKLLITETDYLFEMTDFPGTLFAVDVEFEQSNYSSSAPDIDVLPSDLAYVMYTSGSTGRPKGILVEHKSVVRLVKETNFVQVSPGDKNLGLSSFSFDGSTFDIFMPLLNQGTLVLSTEEDFLNFEKFEELIVDHQISGFFVTTSLFNLLVESELEALGKLKYLLTGGEQASVKHMRRFKTMFPQVKLVNIYGPTENTTFSTYKDLDGLPQDAQAVPIGTNISNSTSYLLDEYSNLVPIGVVGEICLGGTGLARGYLNQPELTKEKFIEHPFKEGERLYKTGDLGRRLSDGSIEFIGRKDDQVKIRGHRIELNEIEHAISIYSEKMNQVFVTVNKVEEEKILVAYISRELAQNKASLLNHLREKLPSYMIPEHFIEVDALPLTKNGKVDRRALPAVEEKKSRRIEYCLPRNEIEKLLTEIWNDVLKLDKISIYDNFFELGGNSLRAVKVIMEIQKKFNIKMEVEALFRKSDIAGLATEIANLSWDKKEVEGEEITDRITI